MSSRQDPQQSEPGMMPFEMITLQSMGAFMLFGPVDGSMSYEACEFIIKANLIQADNDPLTFFINSEGGQLNDGFAIIDVMEASRLPVQTVGTGMIASMSLLVMAAGFKGTRTITKNTEIMAHQWMGGMEGKFHELMAVTDEHKRLERMFIDHFKRHSIMSEKQIKDVLFSPSDRWLSPQECKKYGLCDRVTEFFDVPMPRTKKPAKQSSPAPARRPSRAP